MGTPGNIIVGSQAWVEDPKIAWIEGVVAEINGKNFTIITSNGRSVVAEISSIYPKDTEAQLAGVDDMTKLPYPHEPGVLHNLACRFAVNEIYTYIGKTLIAVNPFQGLPHLYDIHMMEKYKGAAFRELSPHLFAVADNCYRAMINDNGSQSILVSGESGAGKTETTKILMRYLAFMGGRSGAEGRTVEQQVLESNSVLEAFGNAKTVKNNNSSRFGKFIEIQYDKNGKISGAAIHTYLLERSRVCQVSDLERNYHFFYMLCAAPPEDAKKYKLGDPRQFHYLNQSNCYEVSSVDDAKVYLETRNAMDVVGISQEEQESISRVLAAILHLGNIDFIKGKEVDSSKLKDDKSLFHLRTAAELFMCDEKALEDSLCKRVIVTPNGNITKPLDPDAAVLSRDALAKTVYSRLFDWIVDKINSSIGQDSNAASTISVLDIHGFESSKISSFEQLCINLTSEKLQQHFNQHVFKIEQEEYTEEGINWSYVEFVDNQDVLDLIEKKPGGIISLLDEACMLPNSTHETFVQKLCQTYEGHKHFSKPKLDPTNFTINHYAGDVTYQADHFLDNNKDYVVAEHQALLCASKCLFVANLFPPLPEETSKQPKFSSIGSQLKQQLQSLMETLNTTEPCYIRCVKPNTVLQAGKFENLYVLKQLRYGGVLEAIKINCAGYQTKRTFEEFLDRFGVLSPDVLDRFDEKKASIAICDKMGLKGYQMGKTKVFLRAGQEAELDARRAEVLAKAARHIQRQIRTLLTRKEFITLRNATIHIQKIWRAKLARKLYGYLRREAASIRIQKHVHAHRARMNYTSPQASAIVIQSGLRETAARNEYRYRRQTKASIKIQRQWRRVLALSGYKQERPNLSKRLLLWIMNSLEWRQPKILKNFREMSKKAILIGCNYPGTAAELRGCINDVWRTRRCLIAYWGFSRQGIIILIDTDRSYMQPTANNIQTQLSLLVKSAKPGDELFVHFSGHGRRLPSKNEHDDTGYDEYIVATDGNRITDDDFRAVVDLVPEGCRMTILADCCHSGGLIEGAKEQIGDSTKIRRQHSRSGFISGEFENFQNEQYAYVMYRSLRPPNPPEVIIDDDDDDDDDGGFEMLELGESSGILDNQVEASAGSTDSSISVDRGILLSACQSYEGAVEASLTPNSDKAFGVFTDAVVSVCRKNKGRFTYRELVLWARDEMRDRGFDQRPGLYCSDFHADAPFLGVDLI